MMDARQFDLITRGLTRDAPRRRVLGALLAGGLAVLTGTPVSAAKRRRRRGRGEGDGDNGEIGTIESLVPPGTLVGGIWEETIDMCHFDSVTGEYAVIPVSTPSVPDYLNAGATLYIDCCVDTDCTLDPCLIPTGCIEGACSFDIAYGAACYRADGATGVCDKEGYCGPAPGGAVSEIA
jgi:hypothetical protein